MGPSHRRRRSASLVALALLLSWIGLAAPPARAGSFEDGVDYYQGGHYRWALEKFLEAIDQAPRDPQRRWYLAETYRRLGESGAAAHEYRLIIQQTPQHPLALSARRALAALDEPADTRVQVPIQRAGTAILVPVRVNGDLLGTFLLDTGATLLTISRAAAERLGVTGSGGSVRLLTANGEVRAPLALLDEVEVGGAVAHHVPAVIHDLPDASPSIIGLLGLSFLERFRVNLDLSAGLLILEGGN